MTNILKYKSREKEETVTVYYEVHQLEALADKLIVEDTGIRTLDLKLTHSLESGYIYFTEYHGESLLPQWIREKLLKSGYDRDGGFSEKIFERLFDGYAKPIYMPELTEPGTGLSSYDIVPITFNLSDYEKLKEMI